MKLSIVFSEQDKKLQSNAYSQTYRDMFVDLIRAFDEVEYITESCDKASGDVLVYYDVHSSNDITVKQKHPLAYEYFNDPHQKDLIGKYADGTKVTKLGAKNRMQRATDRGVKYAICPYKNGFEKYLRPYGKQELVWFPVAPRPRIKPTILDTRKKEVLANGHLWEGQAGFRPYEFRRWAYAQNVTHVPHMVYDGNTPNGKQYQEFLGQYVASLALCDEYVVPKYIEIPMCGCIPIIQDIGECKELGFVHGVNCYMVDAGNFHRIIKQVKTDPNQIIATNAYKLAMNYTSEKFGKYIYNHAKERLNG